MQSNSHSTPTRASARNATPLRRRRERRTRFRILFAVEATISVNPHTCAPTGAVPVLSDRKALLRTWQSEAVLVFEARSTWRALHSTRNPSRTP